jgi:deoxyribodipyrimidine photo-lyase
MIALHWFRRDLRLADNPALLAAAAAAQQCIPLFVLDDALLGAAGRAPTRIAFLLDSLVALDRELAARGSRLLVLRGDPRQVLPEVCRRHGVALASWNRDVSPYAHRRDAAVAAQLRDAGIATHTGHEVTIVPPEALRTASGGPYTVFTPYLRAWQAWLVHHATAAMPAPAIPPLPPGLTADGPPHLADLRIPAAAAPIPPGGAAAALQRLAAFVAPGGALERYHERRDIPAESATSQLSPYLRFGCLAPAAAWRAAQAAGGAGAARWIAELAWRDFYAQILFCFPHVLRGAFRPIYDHIRWDDDDARFAAWCDGRTGFPIVDAAMRQLRAEAWMHNRCRMIVASFLTKDLLIDWRRGERWFMQHLLDGDPASNNGGWQWAAGTGTDAQPYFRIFNPTSQGQKFDPDGTYVRRYVPELRRVPARVIHEPWRLSPAEQQVVGCVIGRDYPAPVVDHARQRLVALERYRAVRGSALDASPDA